MMEFSRSEEVPKLITVHEASRSKEVRNKLLTQARASHHYQPKSQNYNEMASLHDSLTDERQGKEQLRSAVRELNFQLQKLKEVN